MPDETDNSIWTFRPATPLELLEEKVKTLTNLVRAFIVGSIILWGTVVIHILISK